MTTGAPPLAGLRCACGAPVHIRKTRECRSCYRRRRDADDRKYRLSVAICESCGGIPVTVLASLLCDECARQARSVTQRRAATRSRPFLAGEPRTYAGAHSRLRRLRGPAAAWRCTGCGAPAAQWAYRPSGPRERVTVETVSGRQQRRYWSPEPADYDPLCLACHRGRDHGDNPSRRHDPAAQRVWRNESHARQVSTDEGRLAYRARKNRERQFRSDPYQARLWALRHGHPISRRGPIPQAILDAWTAAGAPRTHHTKHS